MPVVVAAATPPVEPAARVPADPLSPTARPAAEVITGQLRLAVQTLRQELDPRERSADLYHFLNRLPPDPSAQLRQLPSAAQRALQACDDERVATGDLVRYFEQDPTLAEALLTKANSAYYNRAGQPCTSLEQALGRQGRVSAHAVILEKALNGLVCRPGGAWNRMVDRIWSHMVRTGPIARAVAPAFGADPEQAFVLGLLHDVGKLLIFDRLTAQRTDARGELSIPPMAITRTLRILHEPLGGLCALRWNLGDETARALATHHRNPAPDERDPLNEVIWLAEQIDLDTQRSVPLQLEALWEADALSGDLAWTTILLGSDQARLRAS